MNREINEILERAEERQKRTEKMIEKMLNKSEVILQAGKEPMTNEEYIRSCTTEQLAEEIVNMTLLDVYKLYDRMESAEYDIGIGVGAKKVIAEWLKQPHNKI